MFPQGPFARQKLDLDGPFTVARRDMLLAIPGFENNVVIPVGYQMPNWKKLNLSERQMKNLFAFGYIEQAPGKPWALPSPSTNQRAPGLSKPPARTPGAGQR